MTNSSKKLVLSDFPYYQVRDVDKHMPGLESIPEQSWSRLQTVKQIECDINAPPVLVSQSIYLYHFHVYEAHSWVIHEARHACVAYDPIHETHRVGSGWLGVLKGWLGSVKV